MGRSKPIRPARSTASATLLKYPAPGLHLTNVNDATRALASLRIMPSDAEVPPFRSADSTGGPAFLRHVPLPLFPLQPVLARIVRTIARNRPEIFGRIGPHAGKCFLIDPLNMPFVLLLHPDPANPRLHAARRHEARDWDVRMAGSFLTLLAVADGRLDGDALFFTRELVVEGDTEAAVCLRNALDDLEGSIADDIAEMFGPPGRALLGLMRRFDEQRRAQGGEHAR